LNTLYELFKVAEDATQADITEAYNSIIEKANSLPQTDELTQKIQRIKVAYGILSDPEKRKKYDLDLSNKRAKELLENVKPQTVFAQRKTFDLEETQASQSEEEKIKQIIKQKIDKIISEDSKEEKSDLSKKEIKKQQRKARKMAKKAKEYKKEEQLKAYGRYLESQGYKVKYPWTWARVKRLIKSIIVIIITVIIIWHIPFVNNFLKNLCEKNIVVNFLVDAVKSIGIGITETIKALFIK